MTFRGFTNFVSCLAMLYLLWGLYTICSLTSYLILCIFVIYHLHCHRQESGADYLSENFNMDRLYEERPDFFIKLTEKLKQLNCKQLNKQVIHSLHNDGAIQNGCATAAENTERPVSPLTRLPEGNGSQQLPRSQAGNTTTDLEASLPYQLDREDSTNHLHTESEHSGHDLSCSDLEEDSEAQNHDGHAAGAGAGAGAGANETVPKTVITVAKGLTDGSLNTNTDDESKVSEHNQETTPKTPKSLAKALAAETDGSLNAFTEDESKALVDNQETTPKTAIVVDKALAVETDGSVDTKTDDESMALEDNKEAVPSTVISVYKTLAAESKTNDANLEEDSEAESHNGHAAALAAEPKKAMVAEAEMDTNTDDESTVLEGSSETISSSNIAATISEEIDRTINDINNNATQSSVKQSILKEVSDNQAMADTNKGINIGNSISKNFKEKDREVSLSRSNSPTCLGKEEDSKDTGIYRLSELENRSVLPVQPAAEQVEFHKPHGQESSTFVFSPTDDPEKLQAYLMHSPQATVSGLDLSHTHSLEDRHDSKTEDKPVPVNLQNDQTCNEKEPSSTVIDLKDEHDRCSDQDNSCLNQDKNMANQDVNLQKDNQSDSEETKSDPKSQHDRQPDNGCEDGLPSSSQQTQKAEGVVKETQLKSDQDAVLEVSMSPSARLRQAGNLPIVIQQNQLEKWPMESSSDSENESKGDNSANVP